MTSNTQCFRFTVLLPRVPFLIEAGGYPEAGACGE
jgi:hypothetical protein